MKKKTDFGEGIVHFPVFHVSGWFFLLTRNNRETIKKIREYYLTKRNLLPENG